MRSISVKVQMQAEWRLDAVVDGSAVLEADVENLRRWLVDSVKKWSHLRHYGLARIRVADLRVKDVKLDLGVRKASNPKIAKREG